jgi:hypothetical protein
MLTTLFAATGCALALAAALLAYRHRRPPRAHTAVDSGFIGSENVQQQGTGNTLHLHKTDYALVKENELLREQVCHLKKQNRALVKQNTAFMTFHAEQQARYYLQFEKQAEENERLLRRIRQLEQRERQVPFLSFPAKA